MDRRVVITGIGCVSPIGNDAIAFWNNIKKGVCGVREITKFNTEKFRCKVACEVKNLNFEDYFDKKEINRLDTFTKYSLIASEEAFYDANLEGNYDPDRTGVFISSGIGGITSVEKEWDICKERGPQRVSPMFVPMMISNMACGNVAMKFNMQGPCHSITTACSSSSHAIGEAYNYIKFDMADVMLCGGSESTIDELCIAGFDALKALSSQTDINRASIPFDKDRNGFVMGEGAGVLVLEEYEHAVKRGAKIYAEVVGYASTCDAYHVTSPNGIGAEKAMKLAIKNAGILAEDITYINAHGTSTKLNDYYETKAMKNVFGEEMKNYVSSTKSMTGHLLGAAGAIEAICCALSIKDDFVPATINYQNVDEDCDILNLVKNTGIETEVNYAMSNSLGFGGHNATLIFKKVKENK